MHVSGFPQDDLGESPDDRATAKRETHDMESKRSVRDDVLTSLVAFFTGLVAGAVTAFPVGWLTFVLVENDCSDEYFCGLGALIAAGIVGLVAGLIVFTVAASMSLRKNCPVGERLAAGLLTFLGVPIVITLLFAVAGMG